MEHDFEPRDFSGKARLFPLPNLVMFPHAVLPLYIFEPRYRQMTEHALSSDGLITMVQISPPPENTVWTEPVPLEAVGCLGRIIQHERLPDGRFNFLLLGLRRVRLLNEIPTEALYRTAAVEILDDIPPMLPVRPLRDELVNLFRAYHEQFHEPDPKLAEFLGKDIPIGVLADFMINSLPLPPSLKQRLLEELSVDRRIQILTPALRQVVGGAPAVRQFPPAFSVN